MDGERGGGAVCVRLEFCKKHTPPQDSCREGLEIREKLHIGNLFQFEQFQQAVNVRELSTSQAKNGASKDPKWGFYGSSV